MDNDKLIIYQNNILITPQPFPTPSSSATILYITLPSRVSNWFLSTKTNSNNNKKAHAKQKWQTLHFLLKYIYVYSLVFCKAQENRL